MKQLKELLKENKFLVGVELVNSRGIIQQANSQKTLNLANKLCEDKRIDWLSITDSAGGNPTMSPDFLAKQVLKTGKNTIIHLSCKDLNRNGLESLAWKYSSEGFNNLLVISGDYPIDGYQGVAQGVFDLDSVGLLKMLNEMNAGLKVKGRKPNSMIELDRTNFFLGCAVSPFKFSEAEQIMQYEKLKLKVRTGANFIISQLGYDIRKSHELLCFMKESNISIPAIGYVYLLSAGVANIFNKDLIPGCVVSDEFLKKIKEEKKSDDKGKSFFIDFAAKQFVVLKAMGYKGVYIGGIHKYEDFEAIMKKVDEYKNANWLDFVKELSNPQANEFYYYSIEKNTGLSDIKNINPVYLNFKKSSFSKHISLSYRLSRLWHSLFFAYNAPFFNMCKSYYKFLEKRQGKSLDKLSYFNERFWKSLFFRCKECGDCSLPDISYLCPLSQCEKNQRNGPCGGSSKDKCEASKLGKDCIWVRAYARNKYFSGNTRNLLNRRPVINNNDLKNTSGWANCFLLKDHNAYMGRGEAK
ncbi:MAG: methylenetetrahydrofolate reductase C-terminal domain-containing protein [Bacteroidales bacterium]|nr:methylenetetrahydrofolate reductase C-terminal domain-containing protein [Bacteroidales bacterium]